MIDLEVIFEKYQINLSKYKINNVQWQTQECSENTVLFYKFNEHDSKELEKFNNRIKNVPFSLCITNYKGGLKLDANVFSLETLEFESVYHKTVESFYPVDQSNFQLLGVTGTNGKTTTVDLVRQLLVQQKKNVLTIGTLGVYYNEKFIETFSLTTPSFLDIYKTIFKFKEDLDAVVIEVSSHALVQKRFGNLLFDIIAWTNLTQDHLDYHQTMDQYFQAKLLILKQLKTSARCYLPKTQGELRNLLPSNFLGVEPIRISENIFLKPEYNQENLALAVSLSSSIIDKNKINYKELIAPPGRFNIIEYETSFIVIDFAHTPDALKSICSELKETFADKKLVTLFGCGGDRDKGKRELMGKAASEYSDFIYLTSDNPRFEDPKKILDDIIPGVGCEYEGIVDRSLAIKKAIAGLENSILLIAGKGHEDYIEQNGIKRNYNDLDEVNKNIND